MTGRQLKRWRARRNMTQAEAAQWYGVSLRTWQRYEDAEAIPGPLARFIRLVQRLERQKGGAS